MHRLWRATAGTPFEENLLAFLGTTPLPEENLPASSPAFAVLELSRLRRGNIPNVGARLEAFQAANRAWLQAFDDAGRGLDNVPPADDEVEFYYLPSEVAGGAGRRPELKDFLLHSGLRYSVRFMKLRGVVSLLLLRFSLWFNCAFLTPASLGLVYSYYQRENSLGILSAPLLLASLCVTGNSWLLPMGPSMFFPDKRTSRIALLRRFFNALCFGDLKVVRLALIELYDPPQVGHSSENETFALDEALVPLSAVAIFISLLTAYLLSSLNSSESCSIFPTQWLVVGILLGLVGHDVIAGQVFWTRKIL